MVERIIIGTAVLAAVRLLWGWLDVEGHAGSGWVLAAYTVIFVTLATYRSALGERERRALVARAGAGITGGPSMPRLRIALEQVALAAVATGLVLALVYAPQERTMGQLQRIFYVHVPCAWVAYLAFAVVAGGSIGWLWRRSRTADRVAFASAEVGVVFTALVLISGPIWAKPAWGVWWTWDARLTMTLIMWLVYVGYLMLRGYLPDRDREATLGAVVGLLGFVGVPINYMAIRWWRTQHPAPVFGGGEGSGLAPAMARAFVWNLVAFTLIYLAFVLLRTEVARIEEEVEEAQDEA